MKPLRVLYIYDETIADGDGLPSVSAWLLKETSCSR